VHCLLFRVALSSIMAISMAVKVHCFFFLVALLSVALDEAIKWQSTTVTLQR
jgi:hypothetical protein